jgi:REP element-mobilizing transposase RayT
VPHRARPRVRARYPLHVSVRFLRELGSMRTRARASVIRAALVAGCRMPGFRVVDWSIQGDHLHLIVEASDNTHLARGMQGLCVRVARRLNAHLGRRGTVFRERYSARELRTPRETRNARAYVLNNARRHDAQRGVVWPRGAFDPHSSWAWFDGWRDAEHEYIERARAGPEKEAPVARARSWLLQVGWRRHGLVRVDEIPRFRRPRRRKT